MTILQELMKPYSPLWEDLEKFGYRANASLNVLYAVGAYTATYQMEHKYAKWNKISSLVSSVSILGRFVTAGFMMAGISSWLCSYYCFNTLDNDQWKEQESKSKPNAEKDEGGGGGLNHVHEFGLKSSVLLFSISTYYCIGLFSTMEIQEIDIPDIDFKMMEVSSFKFVITGSILASVMSVPTTLMLVDWIKDSYSLYKKYAK